MCSVIWFELLRDIVTRFSAPLINRLKYFLIQFRFRRDIPILRYILHSVVHTQQLNETVESDPVVVMGIGVRVIIDSAVE